MNVRRMLKVESTKLTENESVVSTIAQQGLDSFRQNQGSQTRRLT